MELSLDELKDFIRQSRSLQSSIGSLVINTSSHFLKIYICLVNDGIPANRAIEMMAQVTTGLTREVAFLFLKKLQKVSQLAEGMREWFSLNVVEIIRVGEAGGALAQTMKSAINMLSQHGVAIGSLIGAMAYPLMVIMMACVMYCLFE